MILVILAAALGLLAAPAMLGRWGRRLPPEDWTRLSFASLVGGGVLWELGLGVLALPTILESIHGSGLARACTRALGPLSPVGGRLVGWAAASLAVWSLTAGWRARKKVLRAQQAAHIEAWIGEHRAFQGWELVVLPCEELFAFSVPSQPAQVVVSRALTAAVSADQLEAVIAHERAHLARCHHRHLQLGAAVASLAPFAPGVRRSSESLRAAVERWADEEAAGHSDRRHIREALLSVSYGMVGKGVAAFGGAEAVLERIEALERVPATRSLRHALPVYALSSGFAMAAVGAIGTQGGQVRTLASLITRCIRG